MLRKRSINTCRRHGGILRGRCWRTSWFGNFRLGTHRRLLVRCRLATGFGKRRQLGPIIRIKVGHFWAVGGSSRGMLGIGRMARVFRRSAGVNVIIPMGGKGRLWRPLLVTSTRKRRRMPRRRRLVLCCTRRMGSKPFRRVGLVRSSVRRRKSKIGILGRMLFLEWRFRIRSSMRRISRRRRRRRRRRSLGFRCGVSSFGRIVRRSSCR